MQIYRGARASIQIFDTADRNYTSKFNHETLKRFADLSLVDAPLNGSTEILDDSITGDKLKDAAVTSVKLASVPTSPTLANDIYQKSRAYDDHSDITMLKINVNDNLEHETLWTGLRLASTKILGGRTIGATDANFMKSNASDQWEWLSSAYSQTLLPKTTTTYDFGSATELYSKGYLTNLRLGFDSTGRDYYEKGSWTPAVFGQTSAGVGTYLEQQGYYIRKGNVVWITCKLNITAHSGTGNMLLSGLPYPSTSGIVNAQQYVGTLYSQNLSLNHATADHVAKLDPSSSTIIFNCSISATNNTSLQIDGSCIVGFQLQYVIA